MDGVAGSQHIVWHYKEQGSVDPYVLNIADQCCRCGDPVGWETEVIMVLGCEREVPVWYECYENFVTNHLMCENCFYERMEEKK